MEEVRKKERCALYCPQKAVDLQGVQARESVIHWKTCMLMEILGGVFSFMNQNCILQLKLTTRFSFNLRVRRRYTGPTGEFSSVVLEKTPSSEYIFKRKVVHKI